MKRIALIGIAAALMLSGCSNVMSKEPAKEENPQTPDTPIEVVDIISQDKQGAYILQGGNDKPSESDVEEINASKQINLEYVMDELLEETNQLPTTD